MLLEEILVIQKNIQNFVKEVVIYKEYIEVILNMFFVQK